MPELKTYDLFISHAWKYDDDYNRLVNLLNQANNFKYRNYSVPSSKAFENMTSTELVAELDGQIKPVNCVIVIAGMYVAYSGWIQKEIDIAKKYGKPIIGVKPWGNELTPKAVSDAAKTVVAWNTDSIVSAIRSYSL